MTLSGEPDAAVEFEHAVGREAAHLYAVALTIVRQPADAQDVVQETMISAWRSWSKLRDPARVGPWLTRICVNHCLDRRRRIVQGAVSGDLTLQGDSAKVDQVRLTGELLDFDRVFRRLPGRQRAVVALHYHHGYSIDDCASFMGCRPGTARSHLARAVAKLRKEIGDGA